MISSLYNLFKLLPDSERKKLIRVQFLTILIALAESLSVISISPFLLLLSDSNNSLSSYFSWLYAYFNLSSQQELIFLCGLITIVVFGFLAAIAAVSFRKVLLTGQEVGARLQSALFKGYLGRAWRFHLANNSSSLVNNVIVEADRISVFLIMGSLILCSRIFVVLGLVAVLFLSEPWAAISGGLIFFLLYSFIFGFFRTRLITSGEDLSKVNDLRLRLITEGLGGIKDLKLMDRTHHYADRFEVATHSRARIYANNSSFELLPRYVVEFVAISSFILLVLVLSIFNDSGRLIDILPTIAIFGLATMKLLPACQGIYGSLAQIKIHLGSFFRLKEDLVYSLKNDGVRLVGNKMSEAIFQNPHISIENLKFSYGAEYGNVLENLSLEIPKLSSIALVGPSGCGKSTLVDIIMGFHENFEGNIKIDGKPASAEDIRNLNKNIGYVPQDIFLADSTVSKNIAFGIAGNDIDTSKVLRAVKMANLEPFVESLTEKYESRVGDRGVQLSGGQKQRIGIARALYNDPEILIFDEATSALDTVSESIVMDTINLIAAKKTIVIIAHRLKTVKQCDVIYVLKDGAVEVSGTYEELSRSSSSFKSMLGE